MHSSALFNVFDRQIKPFFIARYRFMFRAVIHIGSFYVFEKRGKQYVADENKYSYSALDKVFYYRGHVRSGFSDKPAQKRGQNKEKRD